MMNEFGKRSWDDGPTDYGCVEFGARGCFGKGGGSGGGTQTTVQKSDPWSGVQPYLTDIFSQAQNQYRSNQPQYFPNQTYVNFAPQTTQALGLAQNRALQGSPVNTSAQDALTFQNQGGFLNAQNPYFSNMADSITQAVRPAVDSQFESSGRYGSGAHSYSVADALAKNIGNLAFNNYGQERGLQQQGFSLSPTLANQDYTDIGQLAKVGQSYQDQNSAALNDAINRWNFQQNLPFNKLSQYSQLTQGGIGAGGTTNSTVSQGGGNGLLNGLGALGSVANTGMDLAGLWSILSDPSMKTDVELIGVDEETGLNVYAFRYANDPKHYPKVVGFMADEVAKRFPEQVRRVAGKLVIVGA